MTTKSYKDGKINGSFFTASDFSDAVLSNLNLTGCKIIKCNLQNADFSNSVITDCEFTNSKNLNLDQIKSTWNYKTGNMTGIKLPAEIQKALDAEKQQVKKNVDKK
jgi:uncharacterized protein YjbI with pentapeptide repeats